jgi:hypothetical protein
MKLGGVTVSPVTVSVFVTSPRLVFRDDIHVQVGLCTIGTTYGPTADHLLERLYHSTAKSLLFKSRTHRKEKVRAFG